MADFDQGEVFYQDVQADNASHESSPAAARIKFREFLRQFRVEEHFIYRDMIRSALGMGSHALEVDIDHLMEFDETLTNEMLQHPAFHLPLFEQAAKEAAAMMITAGDDEENEDELDLQVTLTSTKQPITIRQLLSSQVARVVTIPGIIISASRVKAKATTVFAQCSGCQGVKQVSVRAGFAGPNLPRKCDRPRQPNEPQCPLDPYVIVPEKCKYVDQQTWKLQESPEMVPTGEMPRSVMLSVDRKLVDRAIPGNRVAVTGIMSILSQGGKGEKVAIRQTYLQVLGVRHGFEKRTGDGDTLSEFTQTESANFQELARDPQIVQRLCKSIAPSIFGSEDVKKAIACLLMSGSRKELGDGARLRGDINVLLLGDPSVGKSQYLKFVEKAAPIAVYTSGKGSSAAGLTATVTQDPASREFYLEGGAMVLADGGVVCIDEFDKMREMDRVAIHEAMEQQTISVAKAGITTVLNSRTAVLAAANPTFGRYQEEKNAAEQVDFQSTILSRFDMIFILKDAFDTEFDSQLAKHIIGVHTDGGAAVQREIADDELDVRQLKRFIAYARKTCHPRLDESAMEVLSDHYVQIRQGLQKDDAELQKDGKPARAVPITVRQLEAIVRISESFAKMRLSEVATEDDVHAAIDLFTKSTMRAAKMGAIQLEGGGGEQERTCEMLIRGRVHINQTLPKKRLIDDLLFQRMEESAVHRAINGMVRRNEFEESGQGKRLKRIR